MPEGRPLGFALRIPDSERVAMTEVTLAIGAAARCSDGFRGELKGLVVDPRARAVTHLVVEPEREHGTGQGLARLVPLDHADATAEPIRLRYTEAEFKDLGPAEETLAEFVPGYEVPVQLLPAGEGWRGAGDPVVDGGTIPQIREMETIPLVPETEGGTPEVEESRGDRVRATDDDIGQFHGLRINPDTGEVLQVLVKRHPWGHAELAIPIGNVYGFREGVQLKITKQEAKGLVS
jgi:hypothetical protein